MYFLEFEQRVSVSFVLFFFSLIFAGHEQHQRLSENHETAV